MLDVSLDGVSFRYDTFALNDVTLTFPRSTHTAIIGAPGCGASTLLRLIAGELRPAAGEIRIGSRVVNAIKPGQRPLLYVTDKLDVAGRWSVQHALVNAVRVRTIDRQERFHELTLAASKWQLERILDRKIATLSSTERTRVHLARIELLKPAILVADRLLAGAAPPARLALADDFYRTLRVSGTTYIGSPASTAELGYCDAVVVLDGGRVAQRGMASQVFGRPATEAAAISTGEVNVIPVRIDGTRVESIIGEWTVDEPSFAGSGIALVRPDDLRVAAPGEDSDFVFGIEEAFFQDGRWIARGLLTGGLAIRVALPRDFPVRKGRLIAIRFDPATFTLLPRESVEQPRGVPTDAIPPMRETR